MDNKESEDIILNIMEKSNNKINNDEYLLIKNNLKKMSNILNDLINYDISGTITSGKPFLKMICNEINSKYDTDFDKRQIFNLLQKIGEGKKITENKNTTKYIKEMNGGFYVSDNVQFWLGVIGLIPAFGSVPDAANIIISLLKGNFNDALWSFLAFLPIIGFPVGIYNLFFRTKDSEKEEYYDDDDEYYDED